MAGRLEGKRAIVTAAAQGIGRATALAFKREGAEVLASDINAEALGSLDAEGIATERLDMRDGAAVAAYAERTGPVDILFSCHGFVHAGTILDATEEDFDFAFDLNVRATYRLIKSVLPHMIANGGGSIVTIASVASSIIAAQNRFVYGASKAAVIGLTKSVAADYVTKGIRANAICPGTVDSPSLHERLRAQGDYEAALASFSQRQPMGRIGQPDEIAALAVYLASGESSFVTGQAIAIDGGWTNV